MSGNEQVAGWIRDREWWATDCDYIQALRDFALSGSVIAIRREGDGKLIRLDPNTVSWDPKPELDTRYRVVFE